jgi:ribonuclease HI
VLGAQKWAPSWQSQNWTRKSKQPIEHLDLWKELLIILKQIEVDWQLLAGHVGISANERADKIATAFAQKKSIDLFIGKADKYAVDLKKITVSKIAQKNKDQKKRRSNFQAYSYISKVNGKIKIHKTWAECEARVKGVKGTRFKKSLDKSDEQKIIKEFS